MFRDSSICYSLDSDNIPPFIFSVGMRGLYLLDCSLMALVGNQFLCVVGLGLVEGKGGGGHACALD